MDTLQKMLDVVVEAAAEKAAAEKAISDLGLGISSVNADLGRIFDRLEAIEMNFEELAKGNVRYQSIEEIERTLHSNLSKIAGRFEAIETRIRELETASNTNLAGISAQFEGIHTRLADNDLRAQVADMVREINSIQVTTGLLREERYNLVDDLAKDRDFIRRVASHVDIDDLELEDSIRTELREMLEDRVTVRFEVDA